MFDDIVIGNSKSPVRFCSAVRVFDISVDNISENSESYWISRCILDMGMKVYKDTPQGEKIGQLIENKASKAKIQNYLDKLILENVSVIKLRNAIKSQMNVSREEGKEEKLREIRNVLGVRNNGGYLI